MMSIGQLTLEISVCCALACIGCAQTTQGLIAGAILNVRDGNPIPHATVRYAQIEITNTGIRPAAADGRFALPLLPPGTYRIRVEAKGFQAQEIHQLTLPVAGSLDLVFKLRPIEEVWEQRERQNVFLPGNSVLVFFGPDVDLSRTASVEFDSGRNGILESTLSQVVDPVLIRELPLAGRDVYSILAIQPGIASDAATSRGLGLSVNGQRPSSTNFLLDGLENNNYLLSGPVTAVAPEAVQEYRVSTNNFSAEYGRTSGVVANAVTRSGGIAWHGLGYWYQKNDALNANDYQRNANREPRTPLKEIQPGFFVGGPLRKPGLFASAAVERLRFRSRRETEEIRLPSVQFVSQLRPDSLAAEMFRKYVPPSVAGTGTCNLGQGLAAETGCAGEFFVAPAASLDQTLALARVDRLFREGAHRVTFRGAATRVTRPDFSWSPYPDFVSPLTQKVTGLSLGWINAAQPGTTIEARFGWSADDLRFERANATLPGLAGPSGMWLPGSPLYYSYRNRTHNLEGAGNLMLTRHRHILKAGGGFLARAIDGYQTTGREGYYSFPSATAVATDQPSSASIAVSRQGSPDVVPEYNRDYRYRQWFGYLQGTWRATARFNTNYGVRYDNLGSPHNVGAQKDTVVALGAGSTLEDALRSAEGYRTPTVGDQRLYEPDNRNWAGRFGFALLLNASGRTVVRGAYGVFYDRPFDNLWQTLRHSAVQLGSVLLGRPWNYLEWVRAVPGALNNASRREIFQGVTLFQPALRSPYAQSTFVGIRHQATRNLSIEASAMGSLGRQLIATDLVNRAFGRANTDLADISYRSNQGNSNYYAGAAVVSYRGRRHYIQATYTLGHAIDNQSDALTGEYGDLGFAGSSGGQAFGQAAFSRQYDSRVDRGNSTFDQRHSFVALGVMELPSPGQESKLAFLLRDWRFSTLAAIRSGFPFTVFANTLLDVRRPRLINNRANLANPAVIYMMSPRDGGVMLLNRAAFSQPGAGELGTSGRNALTGPGFWNLDLSLARNFPWRHLGEAGRVTVRADAFNVVNHANLGTPVAVLSNSDFGVALFGRQGYDTGFPAVVPFRETARQLQLMVRIEF
jgi:hypothetical protein